jgi:hypothetical protein
VKPDELDEARRRLFQEWETGAAASGTDTPSDRLLHLLVGAGDLFQKRMADVVGSARAREIRRAVTSDWVKYGPKCDRSDPSDPSGDARP